MLKRLLPIPLLLALLHADEPALPDQKALSPKQAADTSHPRLYLGVTLGASLYQQSYPLAYPLAPRDLEAQKRAQKISSAQYSASNETSSQLPSLLSSSSDAQDLASQGYAAQRVQYRQTPLIGVLAGYEFPLGYASSSSLLLDFSYTVGQLAQSSSQVTPAKDLQASIYYKHYLERKAYLKLGFAPKVKLLGEWPRSLSLSSLGGAIFFGPGYSDRSLDFDLQFGYSALKVKQASDSAILNDYNLQFITRYHF